jgi:hypothetical protein
MGDPYDASCQRSAFIPFMPEQSGEEVAAASSTSPGKTSMKRSAVACAFLLFYVAAYLGVGFAGAAIVERAWLAIFP